MGLLNPSRETELSGANANREIFIFLVQLTTVRIDNLIRLILTLAICDDYRCIHTYISPGDLISNEGLMSVYPSDLLSTP